MKALDMIDALCFDGEGSPYPLEALYDLDGLTHAELRELLQAHKRGEPPQSFARGGARRRIAESLGANSSEGKVLAQQAGAALQQVARVARRHGIGIGGATGSMLDRLDELERRVAGLEELQAELPAEALEAADPDLEVEEVTDPTERRTFVARGKLLAGHALTPCEIKLLAEQDKREGW